MLVSYMMMYPSPQKSVSTSKYLAPLNVILFGESVFEYETKDLKMILSCPI